MSPEDIINLWPDGAVSFRLSRYGPEKWCADLHTYGTSRSETVFAATADEAIAELLAKIHPRKQPQTPSDYEDLI